MSRDSHKPVAAVFCMPEDGHFMLLRPVIAGLVRSGFAVHVFTHRRFGAEIERVGGRLEDLFTSHPLERADADSRPIPCRYVSFAGFYAEEILADLRRLRPALIVYETFAVIGRLAATQLGIPGINVSPNHNLNPAKALPLLAADPRVKISPACHRAVEILRERYRLADASPFSYISGLSPYLNLIGEPPAFLSEEERPAFEPLAFFGCLPWIGEFGEKSRNAVSPYFGDDPGRRRVYACFGTVIWRYYAKEALAALRAVSDYVAGRPDAVALLGLSGAPIEPPVIRELEKPNVRVTGYVDQWSVLAEADVFVSHHGINSTHEAIFHRVPMLSYPFFGDQPLLAEKCRRFGVAVPLAGSLRGPVGVEDLRRAMAALFENGESLQARLEEARNRELEVMARRDSVLRRILELVAVRQGAR